MTNKLLPVCTSKISLLRNILKVKSMEINKICFLKYANEYR